MSNMYPPHHHFAGSEAHLLPEILRTPCAVKVSKCSGAKLICEPGLHEQGVYRQLQHLQLLSLDVGVPALLPSAQSASTQHERSCPEELILERAALYAASGVSVISSKCPS